MTGSPKVRFGTKCASMTSKCSQSAPANALGLVGQPGEVRRQEARRDQRFPGHGPESRWRLINHDRPSVAALQGVRPPWPRGRSSEYRPTLPR